MESLLSIFRMHWDHELHKGPAQPRQRLGVRRCCAAFDSPPKRHRTGALQNLRVNDGSWKASFRFFAWIGTMNRTRGQQGYSELYYYELWPVIQLAAFVLEYWPRFVGCLMRPAPCRCPDLNCQTRYLKSPRHLRRLDKFPITWPALVSVRHLRKSCSR